MIKFPYYRQYTVYSGIALHIRNPKSYSLVAILCNPYLVSAMHNANLLAQTSQVPRIHILRIFVLILILGLMIIMCKNKLETKSNL
jgi:hypothetical protein